MPDDLPETMPEDAPVPEPAAQVIRERGLGDVTGFEVLTGGMISLARRITTTSGDRLVLKQQADLPPDLYECEATGLRAIGATGMRVPEVLGYGPDYLLLEDVGGGTTDDLDWEQFARDIAAMHAHHADRFGFETDNYAGSLAQWNPWTEDGHEFFATNRILRWLDEPECARALTPDDRRRVEHIAGRLSELISPGPPSLLHGDLWSANIVVDRHGVGALIDPLVFYGWALGDIAMMKLWPNIPEAFFSAYHEVNPLPDDWETQVKVLSLRDYLGISAHIGPEPNLLAGLRAVLDQFA